MTGMATRFSRVPRIWDDAKAGIKRSLLVDCVSQSVDVGAVDESTCISRGEFPAFIVTSLDIVAFSITVLFVRDRMFSAVDIGVNHGPKDY
jgi:hypothetical protein